MTDHPSLRRALDAFSEPPPGAAIGTAAVASRAAALRRRRQAAVSGIALTALVVGGTGLVRLRAEPSAVVAVDTTDSPSPSPSPSSESPSPAVTAPSPTATLSPPSSRPPASSTRSEPPAPLPEPSGGRGAYGLEVTIDAAPRRTPTATVVTVTVRARDTDGDWNGGQVDFGDGQREALPELVASCLPRPASEPPHVPEPSDETNTFRHAYRHAGTYTVEVTVKSNRQCTYGKTPEETAKARVTVVVTPGDDPSNGPLAPEARIHEYEDDRMPSRLEIAYDGSDADGWIDRVVVDWGDGSPPETLGRDEEACTEPGGYWPRGHANGEASHDYAANGSYTVTLTVVSSGCDGRDEQTARATYEATVILTGP